MILFKVKYVLKIQQCDVEVLKYVKMARFISWWFSEIFIIMDFSHFQIPFLKEENPLRSRWISQRRRLKGLKCWRLCFYKMNLSPGMLFSLYYLFQLIYNFHFKARCYMITISDNIQSIWERKALNCHLLK